MAYTEILNKIIDKSGLSLREIANKCNEYGVKISPSYVSTLRNDPNNRAPSNEVSRAIAKACNCVHTDILVVESYLDTAPKVIINALENIRDLTIMGSTMAIENSYSNELITEAVKSVKKKPLSLFLLEMDDFNITEFISFFGSMNMSASFHNNDEGYDVTAQLKSAIGLEIKDNSMYPIIQKGSKVIFELKEIQDYSDGDILAYTEGESENAIMRKVAFLNNEHTRLAMFPLNNEYETKTYNIDEITIIGKVIQIITDL